MENRAADDPRYQWGTPKTLFDALHAEYGFTLDVCAQTFNAKLPEYIHPDENGLDPEWWQEQRVWCNPPFCEPAKWLHTAMVAIRDYQCPLAVFLLPANTDTQWFHNYCVPYGKVWFFKGRVAFDPPPGVEASSPRPPVMLVEFRAPLVAWERTLQTRDAKTGQIIQYAPQDEATA